MRRILTAALGACVALGSVVLLGQSATAATLPITAATASSHDGNVPANAIDGNLSTRWSGAGDGVWIRFDLGSVTTVGAISLAWYDGNTRRATFDVQLSQDGAAWSTVLSRATSSGTTLSPEAYDFADGLARYVRVVGYGNSSSDSAKWTSITEATVSGPTAPPTTPPTQTLGVGGVATPAGAILVANQSSKYTINSGGTATAPKVYDCQGNTIRGGVLINVDHVVIQNCRVDAQQQYGIYSDNNTNVTIQNNDIKGVRGPGDLNAITFFGNGHKILYNTAINFVTGDPGDSHTDFIQTWVSSSHPTASDDVQIRGNKAVGPANPGRDNSIPSIHQWLMVEDYGRGGNSGGNTDGMRNWIVADNEIGDSWNQAIKLDGPDNVSITRNKFVGSSTRVMEVTSASTGVKFYSDNQVGSGYGSIGMSVTAGAGPA
ncbi:Right handed beta helix region [Micromonospora pallida]|uniref:Right handed beta helix region n=1 Tax=Micromonospora pallida TaxID=145854 RepID=A0A1C6RUJ8_9ACTN|nr:discoidin domain-containing protein [Micromonospora pallida]SCL20689.1 Right handed beta helix region [Micromonospora pallida]